MSSLSRRFVAQGSALALAAAVVVSVPVHSPRDTANVSTGTQISLPGTNTSAHVTSVSFKSARILHNYP